LDFASTLVFFLFIFTACLLLSTFLENMGGLNCISLVVFAVGGGDTYLLAASYRHLLHQWQKALEKGEGFGERDGFL
jgi:positive regulator of sigma E activity